MLASAVFLQPASHRPKQPPHQLVREWEVPPKIHHRRRCLPTGSKHVCILRLCPAV